MKMKVYITADMEGATGITSSDQTGPEGKDYQRARQWLTGDVNAAVDGALDAGATDILVADSHGNMRNILLEDLRPKAKLLAGSGLERELVQLEGLDPSFDAVILVAFHAMAGTEKGIMSHTWIGGIVREMRLNGRTLGETGLNAATAGAFGVPIVTVAGDGAVCREARDLIEGVATAEVKEGLGRGLALCLPPERSQALIRKASADGLARASSIRPFRVKEPCELLVRFEKPILARQASKSLGLEPHDGDGVLVRSDTVLAALKLAWRMAYVGAFDDRGLRTW
jgi:D-amino peptidase